MLPFEFLRIIKISQVKIKPTPPHFVALSYSGDYDLNYHKFTLPEDTPTQFTGFLANWFLRRF